MLDIALKLLKEFKKHNYEAYIVGGFVRDYLLGIESSDIDITTNATPKEIKEIFADCCLPNEEYGSVIVTMKGVRFEITTFRKEIEYVDNRKPCEVKYIDDLYPDILRRDFIINTICMDENGKIIDFLGGQEDLKNKIIRTVGPAKEKFNEDSLRMLRAIRFATILDFKLSDEVIDAIKEEKHLIRDLSYYRKKNELDKIFNCSNRDYGIKLLLDFGLDEELELKNLDKVIGCEVESSIAVWSLLGVQDIYPFNRNELDLINDINKVMALNNLDPVCLYTYGLYVNSCAAKIKGMDLKNINEAYNNLIIKSRSEIDIDSETIMSSLNKEPGKYIKDIYADLERSILYKRLDNRKSVIIDYIKKNYE